MKSMLLFLTILLIQLSSFPQSTNIKIKVNTSDDSSSISRANISLSDIYFGTTNNFGEADFNSLPLANTS